MFGIGWSEALVIAVLALLFVPTEDLPRLAREAGKQYAKLRRTADELRRAFVMEADRMDASERFNELQERRKKAEEERKARIAEAEARGIVVQEAAPVAGTVTVLTPEEDPETPLVSPPPPAPAAEPDTMPEPPNEPAPKAKPGT
jgi:sec-independent protein translocase protein TatB